MIAYKWVIKKEDKYYPLVNFGINCWMKIKAPPYEFGKEYKYNGEFAHLVSLMRRKGMREIDGFHFWKVNNKDLLNRWNNFLESHKQPKINAILKCEIDDIVVENDCNRVPRIIANKFKVIGEIC